MLLLKKGLLVIIAFSLLLTSLALFNRAKAEWGYGAYEFIAPYTEINDYVRSGLDEKDVYKTLKDAGLRSVSLQPDSLVTLKERGDMSLFRPSDVQTMAAISPEKAPEAAFETSGAVVHFIDEASPFIEQIKTVFEDDVRSFTFADKTFYYIKGDYKEIKDRPLGYDPEAIKTITSYDLVPLPRIGSDVSEDNHNAFLCDQLVAMKNDNTDKLLFYGDEAIGYPGDMEKYADMYKEAGLSLYTVEFADQKGVDAFAKAMDSNVIRLHSLELENGDSDMENVNRVVRAVKERNIRGVFLHLFDKGKAEEDLEQSAQFIVDSRSELPGQFWSKNPQPFPKVEASFITKLFALIGAIALTVFIVRELFPALTVLAATGMISAGLLAVVTDHYLMYNLVALMTGVFAASYAVLSAQSVENWAGFFASYGRAIVVTAAGAWFVVALMYGTDYFVKLTEFRAVKAIYVLPIVIVAYYVLRPYLVTILKSEVRYWHVAVGFVMLALLLYYVMRSGNEASVTGLEMQFRQWLEDVFYVRPRTKEWLIGLPLFVLGLYLQMKGKKGMFLYIPGVIGFLSIVNTFTHFHIPLYLSVLRTVCSLGLGLALGFVFIGLYRMVEKWLPKLRSRWEG